jgi:site-specific recombinase XerD
MSKPTKAIATRFSITSAMTTGLGPGQRDTLEAELLQLWNNLESVESRRAYRADWRKWCEWLAARNTNPSEATAATVQRYLLYMGDKKLKKATRARALAVLRKVYAAYVRADVIKANPAREADNIRVSSDPTTPWMSPDQLRRLIAPPTRDGELDWRQHRDWVVMLTLAGTGLRRRDVARLLWSDLMEVDRGKFVLRVTVKGSKEGMVSVPSWVLDALGEWATRIGCTFASKLPLFPAQHGPKADPTRFISDGTVRNIVKRSAKRAGVELRLATPHAIRRSFTTIALQRGASLKDLQATLLHASQTTTERYDKAARISKDAPGELLADLMDPEEDDDA